jgi:hypothetical protein
MRKLLFVLVLTVAVIAQQGFWLESDRGRAAPAHYRPLGFGALSREDVYKLYYLTEISTPAQSVNILDFTGLTETAKKEKKRKTYVQEWELKNEITDNEKAILFHRTKKKFKTHIDAAIFVFQERDRIFRSQGDRASLEFASNFPRLFPDAQDKLTAYDNWNDYLLGYLGEREFESFPQARSHPSHILNRK